MTQNLPAADWFDPKKILAQYLEGKETEEIAAGLGINREKLIYHLTTKAPEDWKEAQLIRAIKRYDEAETAIDDADDMLKLNKAREKLKSAQWIMERVCRRIYGDTKELPATQPVHINIGIRHNEHINYPDGAFALEFRDLPPKDVTPVEQLPEAKPEPLPAPKPDPKVELQELLDRQPQPINYGDAGSFV